MRTTTLQSVKPIDIETIKSLWKRFSRTGPNGDGVVALEDLAKVMADLGEELEAAELRHLLDDDGASDGLAMDQFVALMASLRGDTRSRLVVAFDVFDANGDGRITVDELGEILCGFGMSRTDLELLFAEFDRDGSGTIGFEDFCALLPNPGESTATQYRSAHLRPTPGAEKTTGSPPTDETVATAHPSNRRKEPGQRTSRLQMQIGLFRLLQGAAYRSFRENCAANYETHLRAKTLPYTITHFVDFADKTIALYKALGIVARDCHPALDAVTESLREEFQRLEDRIANWESIEKSPQMRAAEEAMAAIRARHRAAGQIFAAGVECALTLRRKNLKPADLGDGALEIHEINRLRLHDLDGTLTPASETEETAPEDYLKSWNRVILQKFDEEIDGAMMPAAYWYEDFVPKLLGACSVSNADEIAANAAPNEAMLDHWFEGAQQAGEFHPFGAAVAEHFVQHTPLEKLRVRQAWRLNRHYLNGVQKRRERLEYGRETGFLSEYVAFLDVYLGRNDVRDAQMRLSFPYFVGPATWRFLHTAAQIISDREPGEQEHLVMLFKDFFRLFATMYPCPYCRHHLNRYVVRNREVETYPLEYLILGAHPERGTFEVSIDDKLDAIVDGKSLSLFLWKLHNTVSSSIARAEPWFHRDEGAFYTTRYWPSQDAERARAQALSLGEIEEQMRIHIISLEEPVGRLSELRRQLACAPSESNVADAVTESQTVVEELETALAAGAFLEATYRFDPDLEDDAPHFTPEEEAYSRSGLFVEA